MVSPDIERMLATAVQFDAVRESAEVRRVRELPHYIWQDKGEQLAEEWTRRLRTPKGMMHLRPIQGAMLQAAVEHRGLFAPARTGAGKLLTSLLLFTVLGLRKGVLVIPASRREPTYAAIRELSKHWQIVPFTIITYTDLSQAANQTMLERMSPDGFVLDEGHMAKDAKGARWKRINRIKNVPFCTMSGTFSNRAMLEYWHLLKRALGEKAPVPMDWAYAVEWDRALNPRSTQPLDPGALLTLMPPSPLDGVGFEAGRSRYGRRLVCAPGVVSSGSDIPDIPLFLHAKDLAPSQAIREAANHMLNTWTTPCGYPIDTAVDMWRHLQEVSSGFVYRWKDIPPAPWLAARKEVSAFIREITSNGKYDLPSQVYAAVATGELKDPMGVVEAWHKIEPSYTPVMLPVWICDSTLKYASEWLFEHRGIVWTQHQTFGERLTRMTGVPYFRDGACNLDGVHIENHRGPAIASLSSCSTGHNLQHHNMNLYLSVPPPTTLEQSISRTHRDGQLASVGVEFLLRLDNDHAQLKKARMDADALQRTFQVTQRIHYGQWTHEDM